MQRHYLPLKHFQDSLYRRFKKLEVSNQPRRFFATAKAQRFSSLNDIIVKNFKLHPIIDLKEAYTYKGNGHFQRINTPSQTVALWEVP